MNFTPQCAYHTCPPDISPSLLACDLSSMATESIRVLEAGADSLHIDVMDGHFVPNLTFGAPVIKCLRKNVPDAIFDAHLMVAEFGVDIRETIQLVKSHGMAVGLAVKPDTPIDSVFPYIEYLDHVLVMTVEPGFGGQTFRENMLLKVAVLRERYPTLNIQVDGGLSPATIGKAAAAGANRIVAGSAVFKSDPATAIEQLRSGVERYGHGKVE